MLGLSLMLAVVTACSSHSKSLQALQDDPAIAQLPSGAVIASRVEAPARTIEGKRRPPEIVITVAMRNSTQVAVIQFFRARLRHLGWQPVSTPLPSDVDVLLGWRRGDRTASLALPSPTTEPRQFVFSIGVAP